MASISSNKKLAFFAIIGLLLGGWGVFWFGSQLYAPINPTEPFEPLADGLLNVSITETGIYAISTADIRSAGVSLGDWGSQPVALTEQGEPIPYLIQDGQLIFFGEAQDSVYSRFRVYRLHFGSSATGKIVQFDTFPAAPDPQIPPSATVGRLAHFEQDTRYLSIARTNDDAPTWFWDQIHVGDLFEFTADLPHAVDGSAEFRSQLFGVSHDGQVENDHDLDLVINGTIVGQIVWDGNIHHTATVLLPAGTLKKGDNTVLLDNRPEGNTFIDISELDWVTVTYQAHPIAVNDRIHFESGPATLELSGFSADPLIVARFNSGSLKLADGAEAGEDRATVSLPQSAEVYAAGPDGFHVPAKIESAGPGDASPLATAEPQTDFIIITDRELAPSLAPLISAREAQGLAVTVATVEQIYNQFGHGQPSPQAIQAYLAHALESWPKPAPRYLLLAGGTTYDFRENLGGSRQNRVPSMLIGVSHSGETVSDARLADVDNDGRTDFAVGRWPVDSPAAVASLVERTLAYEQSAVSENSLFAADGTLADFGNTADRLISAAKLEDASIQRAYGASWEDVTGRWNAGNWIVTYVGHGSVDLWGSQEVLSSERVSGLRPPVGVAPPIVLQFTCLTGFFAHPLQPSISEKILLDPNGPVLLVSATSLTYSSSQEPFAKGVLAGLTDPNLIRMGDVLAQAHSNLDISSASIKEVYDTFGLMGDPTTIIARPGYAER